MDDDNWTELVNLLVSEAITNYIGDDFYTFLENIIQAIKEGRVQIIPKAR